MESFDNDYLKWLYETGYSAISEESSALAGNEALERIAAVCGGYTKVCVGYSSGKDSIVVNDLMSRSGIPYTPVMWKTRYQFEKNEEWLRRNAPPGLVTVEIPRPTYEDMEKNPDLLFTATKKADNIWMSYKWKAQRAFLSDNGFDLFVTGRRIAESNNCGARKDGYVRKGKAYDSFSPIAEWGIGDVIAHIRYNSLEVPWQYLNTPGGFMFGSVAWPERRRFGKGREATVRDRWAEIYEIERGIVEEAAEHLTSAKAFLEERNRRWS